MASLIDSLRLTREELAEHRQALRTLPCAGHEIRISKMQEGIAHIKGIGIVVGVLIPVVVSVAVALL